MSKISASQRLAGEVCQLHSWDTSVGVNGPGMRLTLFLNGCPLRCAYCHNPDTMFAGLGTTKSFDTVLDRVLRYERVYRSTGGGLTVSGGEPLMQYPFVKRLFLEVHKRGIHTALDTSGFLGRLVDDEFSGATDLVLLDVKSGIPEVYRKVTGKPLRPTVDFGNRLNDLGKRVWVRFVVVPGVTDGVENVDAVGEIVSSWGNVEWVEVLPFHQYGLKKWAEWGLDYKLADVDPATVVQVQEVVTRLERFGLNVR